MVDVVLVASGVAALIGLFGVPAVLVLTPEPWRPWWPALLPIAGLATFAAVMQPLATLMPVGRAALPAVGLGLVLVALAWRHRVPLPRPSGWCVVALLAAFLASGLAYAPSVRYGEPRAPGILNIDAIYYLTLDEWLQDHRIGEVPPRVSEDGYFAPAREAWDNSLRVGVDLVDASAAVLLRTTPAETLPGLIALLTGFGALAAALFVRALGAPTLTAALAALLVAVRPEAVRLGLDSFVAQIAGLALAPAALGAIALALHSRDRRGLLLGGLLASGLVAYYTEYAPFLVVAGGLIVLALLVAPDRREPGATRPAVLRAAALLAAAAVVCNPLAAIRGVASLLAAADNTTLRGEVIVPFYGVVRDVAFVTGPFSVVRETAGVVLVLSLLAGAVALIGVAGASRRGRVVGGAALVAAALFVLQLAVLAPYSYGLGKVLSLAGPFVLAGLALATVARPRFIRPLAGALVLALVIVNGVAAVRIGQLSLVTVNGAQGYDRALAGVRPLLGDDAGPVALEGTDFEASPDARQHYGVYYLRSAAGLPVSYARGKGSYFTLQHKEGPLAVDRTFRADYRDVVSLGPSLSHGPLVGVLGRAYFVYRREPVDVLVVGAGWRAMETSPEGEFRWSLGDAKLWLSSPRPARVALDLRLRAPGEPRRATVVVGGRQVGAAAVAPAGVTEVRTRPFTIPAGRTVVRLRSNGRPDAPDVAGRLGVGLLSVRAPVR